MGTNARNAAAERLIPGAYDRSTLTHRQPGSMGGAAFGSADIQGGPSSMDASTIAERELEGGGGVSERRRKATRRPQRGPALANVEHTESQSTAGGWWFQLLRLARR